MRKSFTRLFGLFILFVSLLSFQVVAQGAPFSYSGLSPSDGACDAHRSGDYVITFDRNVYPSNLGVFGINNINGTELITMQLNPSTVVPGNPNKFQGTQTLHGDDVVNWSITFDGNQVKINFGDYVLLASTAYYITVSEDAIKDKAAGVANFFEGLTDKDDAPTFSLVACTGTNSPNNSPGWDFTTVRAGDLTYTKLDPADNSNNVPVEKGIYTTVPAGDTTLFRVHFNRPVFFPDGSQGTVNLASAPAWLKAGYFALYTSTDGTFGQYGGDVDLHHLSFLRINGSVLEFGFDDKANLDYNRAYYLRVRYELIQDQYGNKWEGINTNHDWNFTTKDGFPAFVDNISFNLGACAKPATRNPIKIVFKDGYNVGSTFVPTATSLFVKSGTTYSAATISNIKQYLRINDASNFNVSSVDIVGLTVEVVITPTADFASNADVKVDVLEGLFDAGRDPVAAYSKTLTSGDYTAPVSATITGNADGTTFDIMGRLNEVGDIFFVVVPDTTFKVGSTTYNFNQASDLFVNGNNNTKNRQAVYNQAIAASATGTINLHYIAGTSTAVVPVYVWGSGVIKVDDPDLTYLERIKNLLESDGRYYNVLFFSADVACEGAANSLISASPNYQSGPNSNITPLQRLRQATLDILAPRVEEWTADLVKDAAFGTGTFTTPAMPNCNVGVAGGTTMHRNGAIYVKMNENVEKAAGWGQAITNDYIPSIFNVEAFASGDPIVAGSGDPVALNWSACEYNEATNTFKLVPLYPFTSGSNISVSFRMNRIQDKQDDPAFGPNGTELLDVSDPMYTETFCVEYYAGPVALCTKMSPKDGDVNVDRDATITIAYDQKLYAPGYDGSGAISNNPADATWIGNYLKIYESDEEATAQFGSVLHQFDNPSLDMFAFDFENTPTGAVITIELLNGNEYNSEMFYYVEVEKQLQTAERYTLGWSDADLSQYEVCLPNNFSFVFQSEDSRSPLCIFYEDDDMDYSTGNLGELDLKMDVDTASYILVEIDEWVALGFDGFKNLDPTQVIADANALRPYFTLKNPAGENIRFDVKNFTLDATNDIATFYIDPYEVNIGTIQEDPNFIAGLTGYEVCFLGASDLLNPAYADDSILVDDNDNGVGRTCATFGIYQEVEPFPCLDNVTLNGTVLDITSPFTPVEIAVTADQLLTLVFNFGEQMQGDAGSELQIRRRSDATVIATVASDDFDHILYSDNKSVQYVFDMTGNMGWVDNEEYDLFITLADAMTTNNTLSTCRYPETDAQVVAWLNTIDGSAPVITDWSFDGLTCWDPKAPTNLVFKFDEPVTKQTGFKLEIRRSDAITQRVTIDASNGTYSAADTTLTFSAGLFANFLQFDVDYHLVIPAGFVKNEVGLPNATITNPATYAFVVCGDTDPNFICDQFSPLGFAEDVNNFTLEINFDEPVTAVNSKNLQIYSSLAAANVVNLSVSSMQRSADGKTFTYTVTPAAWATGRTMHIDSCYLVNIDGGAFVDATGNPTSALYSVQIGTNVPDPTCIWGFCFGDVRSPIVKLWPEEGDVSIPVNAHLYAFIDEEPWVITGIDTLPLVATLGHATSAKQFFNVEWNNAGTWTPVTQPEWTLEFVGTSKKHMRIAVYETAGYDYNPGNTGNPVMRDDTEYRLIFNPIPTPGTTLVDEAGNTAVGDTVTFTTEDVTAPTIMASLVNCGDSPNSINFTAELNEPGTVRYVVKNKKSGAIVAQGTEATDEFDEIDVTISNLVGSVAGGYTYTVELWASDLEQDLYETVAQIEGTWMFDGNGNDDFAKGTLLTGGYYTEYNRIRDFIPAPNGETKYSPNLECTLCDDDAPIMASNSYPKLDGTMLTFPLGDSIVLKFDENVQLTDAFGIVGAEGQGYSIMLRDFQNNLAVPLGYAVSGMHITLYPLDSAAVPAGIENQFLPYAGNEAYRTSLESQRKYYLEIERYAISDFNGCDSVNYYPEKIGKALWFETKDATPPCLVNVAPFNDDATYPCGVSEDAPIVLTFNEKNGFVPNVIANDSNYVYIYRNVSGVATPHDRLAISQGTISNVGETWTISWPNRVLYRSSEEYIVRVPSGVFKDSYGNVWTDCVTGSADSLSTVQGTSFPNGYTWTFRVRDYMPPVPTWTVVEHLDYLDIVLDDDHYNANIHPDGTSTGLGMGEQGGVIGPIATSSFIKVHFDEEVYIRKTASSNDYLELSSAISDKDYINRVYSLFNITVKGENEAAPTALVAPVYGGTGGMVIQNPTAFNFKVVDVPNNQTMVIEIYQGVDQWTPFLTDSVTYGLNSNSTYVVNLNANIAYDDDVCDGVRLPMGAIDALVTINTRDDVPPTLEFFGTGKDLASDVKGKGSYWKDNNHVEQMVICVDKDGPLTLKFDDEVLKTPYVGIGYESISYADWVNNNINWYTEANLPLRKADLLTPNAENKFLHVYKLDNVAFTSVGSGAATKYYLNTYTKTPVELSDVEIVYNGQTIIDLILKDELASQGFYQIVFKPGVVKDTKREPNGNVFLGDSIIFKVEDYKGPLVLNPDLDTLSISTVKDLVPANDPFGKKWLTSNVDGLWIKYDQPILKGSGTLEVRWMNGQQSVNVPIANCVTVESNTAKTDTDTNPNDNMFLYIPLPKKLDDFQSYYVIVPEGFVTDVNECVAIGSLPINEDEQGYKEWVFHVADATPPMAMQYIPNNTRDMDPASPTYGDIITVNDSVPTGSPLSIIFDENIMLASCATGGVFIYHNDLLDGFELGTDFGNYIEFIPFSDPTIKITGTDPYKGKTRDMITFQPQTTFEKKGIYYIRVSSSTIGCGILDDANNPWASVEPANVPEDFIWTFPNDTITWSFVVSNDVEPMLATTTPAYNHAVAPNVFAPCFPANDSGYVIASMSMTFTDNGLVTGTPVPVLPREGKINIYEYRYEIVAGIGKYTEKLWKAVDVNDPRVVFSGNTVTLNDIKLRDNINGIDPISGKPEFYYVTIESGAIINAYPGSTSYFAGIKNAFTWRFQTCADDVFVAGYEIVSPNEVTDGADARNLSIDAAKTLVVEFNEGIEALDAAKRTGMVKIFDANSTSKAAADSIYITPSMCSGTTLTVVSEELKDETEYYVVIGLSALGDTSTISTPNSYVIGGADVWTFHTGDNTPPYPVTFDPADGDDCVFAAGNITLTFGETFGVTKNTTNAAPIEIKDAEGATVATIAVADVSVSEVDANIVTIPYSGLPDTTVLTVFVPEAFFLDNGNNTLPNGAFDWTFTTGENTAPTLVGFAPAAILATGETTVVLTFSEDVTAVAGVMVTIASENGSDIREIEATDFVVDTLDANIYSIELDTLLSEQTYTVTIAEGAFIDANVGCVANPIAEVSRTFTVGDILAPTATYAPDGITLPDYLDVTLSIFFDDAVTAVAGKNVVVYNAVSDTVVKTIAATAFTGAEDNTVYSLLTNDLKYGHFYVLIDSGAFVDNAAQEIGKYYAGIVDETEWAFAIIDSIFDCANPTGMTPARETTDVPLKTTISITFCQERIKPGTGYVTVGDQSAEQVEGVNYFIFSAEDFDINGSTLSIDVEGLQELTKYSVIISPDAILDEAGNSFIGIIDANKWWFVTGDFTAPVVTVENVIINNVTGVVGVTSSELGEVFIASGTYTSAADIIAAIAQGKAKRANVVTAGTAVEFSAAGLVAGTYKAYAVDATGNFAESVNTFEITDVPLLSIKAIQGEAAATPYEGKMVATRGVVTAVTADGKGYFIQDAIEAWSGIYVYDPTLKAKVLVGSGIKVIGTASEYNGLTQIKDLISVDFIAPVVAVEAIELTNLAEAKMEKYEGVLVKVKGVRAVELPNQYKEWKVAISATDSLIVDDQFYAFTPTLGVFYNITGVVNFTFNYFKVAPRMLSDIQWGTDSKDLATSIKVYPNPFDRFITIEVSSNVEITKAVITNIAGQLIKEVINPDNTIPTSELRSGVYFISLHTEDGIAKTERIIKR